MQNTDFLFEAEPQKSPAVLGKTSLILVSLFSIGWLFFVGDYLLASGWWHARAELAPAELVGGLAGLVLPIVVAWLLGAYFSYAERIAAETKTLKSYLNELVYPSEEGAVYTKTLTETLKAQIKEFRTVFREVNEQTQAVRDDLKHWVADLSKVIHYVDTQTVESVREIAAHIQKLTQSTAAANEQAQQASALFSEQAVILQRVTAQTAQTMGALTKDMSASTEEMQHIAHGVDTANARLAHTVGQAAQIGSSLREGSASLEQAVQAYAESASEQNARLFGNLEQVLAVFKAQGELLNQEVEQSARKLQLVESDMSAKTQGLFTEADTALGQLAEAGQAFEKQAQKVQQALLAFKKEFADVPALVAQTGKALPATAGFSADVLQEASLILNRLQGFSVDIAHIFTPKDEEKLWSAYYAGDKAVFMRTIARQIAASKANKISELSQKNKAFRQAVQHYMAAFEEMTRTAQADELVLGVLIGSDVGRLYMVLADVFKQEKEHESQAR